MGDEMKHIDRAAGASLPRVPPSLARRCTVLAVGSAIALVEFGVRTVEDARTTIVRQLDALTASVAQARDRLLGRSERDA